MLEWEFCNGFRCKFRACFIGIDGLMFCTMITEKAFDIRHETDCPDITNQQDQTDNTFEQVIQPCIPAKVTFGEPSDPCGQQEEQTNPDRQRQSQRRSEEHTSELQSPT